MTNYLREHAEREFALLPEDALFYTFMEDAVLDILDVIADQGHSGTSIHVLLDLVQRLALKRNLASLTDDPDEWFAHSGDLWQNQRNSACFSTDHGTSYTSVDDKLGLDGKRPIYYTEKSGVSDD